MGVLALIPARCGSKGIPQKNFRALVGGLSPVDLAIRCADIPNVDTIIVSTDKLDLVFPPRVGSGTLTLLPRPSELAADETAMIAVIRHALAHFPGEPDDIVLLLEPTQPLRTPEHVQQALRLFKKHWMFRGTVASVTETESPDKLFREASRRAPWLKPWGSRRTERRQEARRAWRCDGTVYAWRRRDTFMQGLVWGLKIRPEETCALDTPADWAEAERRLREKEARHLVVVKREPTHQFPPPATYPRGFPALDRNGIG